MGSNLVKALPLFQEHINKLQNLKSNQFKNLNINASSMHINKNTSEGRLNLKLNQLTKYSLNLTSAGSTQKKTNIKNFNLNQIYIFINPRLRRIKIFTSTPYPHWDRVVCVSITYTCKARIIANLILFF